MNRFRKALLFSSCLFLIAGHAQAAVVKSPAGKPVEKELKPSAGLAIVAVVGEQAISSFDLESRIKFILVTTRMSNTPEVIAGIRPQVLRTLIDESLQMQESARNNISVEDKEVAQTIAGIEAQKGMPAGEIARMLSANNVPMKTYTDQVRSQLAWNKLLGKKVRGRIKISDGETIMAQTYIRPAEEKTEAPVNIKEMEIAVINLPIDSPKRVPEIKKLVERLYGELRKGAKFEEVARQFSAGGDGKPFWIRPQQLDPNVAQALLNTKEGAITPPVPTRDGFSIIRLVSVKAEKQQVKEDKPESKEFEISLKEILLKLKVGATAKEADVLLQIGNEVAKNPGTCEEKGVAGIEGLSESDIVVNMRKGPLSKLNPALRGISEKLKIGEVSTPFASTEGIRLYMLCGKKEVAAKAVSDDQIRDTLYRQKFELEAQKYLRDLRRETFIDVRL